MDWHQELEGIEFLTTRAMPAGSVVLLHGKAYVHPLGLVHITNPHDPDIQLRVNMTWLLDETEKKFLQLEASL